MLRMRFPEHLGTVLGAGLMATLGSVPVFLLSLQSVFVRQELDFGEAKFGVAVSAFFLSASSVSIIAGRWADRIGRKRGTVTAGLLAATGGFGLSWTAHSWSVLVVMLMVLG